MFENFVKGLVRKYLQDYVDLNASALDSLAVSIWKGSLTIQDVSLRADTIQALLGPGVEVVHGVVGNISIK